MTDMCKDVCGLGRNICEPDECDIVNKRITELQNKIKELKKRFLNLRTLSIEDILIEIGAKGLCEPDTDCGCDIGDLAPCGVDCVKCRPASCKIATAEDVLKYPNLELDEGDFLFKEFEVIK